MNQLIFLFCLDYIKNNSFINLDVEIKSELFSLVAIELKYTRKIYSIKNFVAGFPVEVKNLIR